LRHHVFVRLAKEVDGQLYLPWAAENADKNGFDPEVPFFSSSRTWCAFDKDGPLAYQTIQRPVMLESVAPRPGATKEQIAVALKELTQNAVTHAFSEGAGEIYYLGTDADTDAMATNQVFEKLPNSVYRLKLKDLTTCS
jgi:hypothetical protein